MFTGVRRGVRIITKTTTTRLIGTGAAYIRVSTNQQDTERQHASIEKFQADHGVNVPKELLLKDEGWARDTADTRPEFQRLMKMAEDKKVQWIVVDALDRFGTKNAKQLISYLNRLDEAGCKLFDASGREWTGEDIATIITAVVEGDKSRGEQMDKSYRTMSGKAVKARAGEWQGGPPRFGFDVACYSRETGEERWRVIYEGYSRRLKVYPDGRTERFDKEKRGFPQHQEVMEVMRVTPSKDKGKIAAVVNVFKRFATESVNFATLAMYLNDLKHRNWFGGHFKSHHVRYMLGDPIYMGYYSWNKRHHGKFHRFKDGMPKAEMNYDERETDNPQKDWVRSERLFNPLVDQQTWATVQEKLAKPKRVKAPQTATTYLSGLLHCGNCGGRMVVGPARKKSKIGRTTDGRREYMCGTYQRAVAEGRREECSCLRNGVFQDILEPYIERFLNESGKRLEFLTEGLNVDSSTDPLEKDEAGYWDSFTSGIERLTGYLAKHHPDEYAAIVKEHSSYAEDALGPDDFVAAVVDCYRKNFNSAAVAAEIEKLEAEHSTVAKRWTDLPTPRAKEKAKKELEELELRIGELEKQQEDVAGSVEQHRRDIANLQKDIAEAKNKMRSPSGERALRQRAEALRRVIHRVECTFVATGHRHGGPGVSTTRLTAITFYPIDGETVAFRVDQGNVIRATSVVSAW